MQKNKILQSIQSNALTFQQLKNLAGTENSRKCKWLLYDQLQQFKNIEDLMNLGAVIILLTIERPRAPKVGHFILLLDQGNHYEHFDSYGLNMDEELSITQEHHLTNIFKMSRKPIKDNTVKLQMFREDVNTCGRWVVARLLLRDWILEDFLSLIKYFVRTPDDVVAAMTLLLQFKK